MMNLETNVADCDRRRLELYLDGELADDGAQDVERHLAECADCRETLERLVGSRADWDAAQSWLKADEFDSRVAWGELPACQIEQADGSLRESQAGSLRHENEADILSREIRGWLDPTDDPKSLGRFAGYEIVGIVGHGGMGIVLKGFEAALNRFVAIKVLAPRLATNGSARQRFAREAQAAAAVLHENVIAIHRVDQWHGLPFLVMPYIGGVSLQRRLDSQGPLAIEAALRIGVQVAAGLAAAHGQGLVHRDIKPANILLDNGVERVTITDFGLARAADDASVTRTGMIAGTPQYMSPEQALAREIDARSDLFSLGSVLYTMAAGRPPFRGEGSFEILKRIEHEPARRLREINPSIPDWYERLVERLHAKSPEDRPASAAETQRLLNACLLHVTQPGQPIPAELLPPASDRLAAGTAHAKRQASGNDAAGQLLDKLKSRTGVIVMIAALGLGLLGLFLWQSSVAPDISGRWTGEDWGQVVLEEQTSGKYQGTYTDTFGKEPGTLQLKWSRIEQRFNGTWQEGKDRFGRISVRLVDREIRGAWTTNKKSQIEPGGPGLADLLWVRDRANSSATNEKVVDLSPVDQNAVLGIPDAKKLTGTWQGAKDGIEVKLHFHKDKPWTWAVRTGKAEIFVELVPVHGENDRVLKLRYDYKEAGSDAARSAILGHLHDGVGDRLWLDISPSDLYAAEEQYKPVNGILLQRAHGTDLLKSSKGSPADDGDISIEPMNPEKATEFRKGSPDEEAAPADEREQIGTSLGQPVYRDQIRTEGFTLRDELHRLFSGPVVKKFWETNRERSAPTPEELAATIAWFKQSLREQLEGEYGEINRRQLKEVTEALKDDSLSNQKRDLLQQQKQAIERSLDPDDKGVESAAALTLMNWKQQRFLYDQYGGGRILWQQFGTEAFDAMHKFLKQHEAAGDFTITDPKLRAEFYEYWTNEKMHGSFLTDDKERIRSTFLQPPWLAK